MRVDGASSASAGGQSSTIARMSFWLTMRQLVAVDLELGPGVLGVEDLVARLDVHRLALAVVEDPARADGDDRALLGLLLGGVRQDDAALGHLLAGGRLDDDAVAQRAKLGRVASQWLWPTCSTSCDGRAGRRASDGGATTARGCGAVPSAPLWTSIASRRTRCRRQGVRDALALSMSRVLSAAYRTRRGAVNSRVGRMSDRTSSTDEASPRSSEIGRPALGDPRRGDRARTRARSASAARRAARGTANRSPRAADRAA